MKVYLIDDDIDDQEIFRMALAGIDDGIVCATANDGYEAIRSLSDEQTTPPEYIFIDVNMPKMNGIQCLKELKQLAHLKDTRMFMFSTSEEFNIAKRCNELGAADFIVKPSSVDSLTNVLLNLLQFRKARP